ncbi:hypothetical protein WH52_07315 [Tenacibaculum holothuriorum]|uniref:Curli production assembly/transport component CsgE n=1 Tax=Tenacibaculum holothuriorum TaxID=1635173 RepID=A0A1Y2PFV1_9FLAO|nr:hypothetical protein WH52_07315 [Tenacibaculum holothuriorum]
MLFVFIQNSVSQEKNDIQAKINMEKKDNFLILRAQIENQGLLYVDELKYLFIALKKDVKKNYSNNKQSGEFSIAPKEQKLLSQIRLNVNKEEELKVYLFVRKNNKLVTKDSLFILPNDLGLNTRRNNREIDFLIKGIVTDETITKIGKDFHDYFYQQYLLGGKKFPFVIKIKEKPGMGRSSILSINVEDQVLYEFFSKPDEEHLRAQVNVALGKIYLFARKREKLLKKSKLY